MYNEKIKKSIEKWRANNLEKYNIYQKNIARKKYQNNPEVRIKKIKAVQFRSICIVFRNILLD